MEERQERRDGKIIEKDIEKEMREAYIDYAMSVIVSRALPDVRDGLKPVHRRYIEEFYIQCMKMGLHLINHTGNVRIR